MPEQSSQMSRRSKMHKRSPDTLLDVARIKRDLGLRFGFHSIVADQGIDKFELSEIGSFGVRYFEARYEVARGNIEIHCPRAAKQFVLISLFGHDMVVFDGYQRQRLNPGDIFLVCPETRFDLHFYGDLSYWGFRWTAGQESDEDCLSDRQSAMPQKMGFVSGRVLPHHLADIIRVFKGDLSDAQRHWTEERVASSILKTALNRVLEEFQVESRPLPLESSRTANSRLSPEVFVCLRLIDEHLEDPINVDQLCRWAGGLSRSTLTRKFREESDMRRQSMCEPGDYRWPDSCLKAKELEQSGPWPIVSAFQVLAVSPPRSENITVFCLHLYVRERRNSRHRVRGGRVLV